MFKVLELSRFFVCLGGLLGCSVPGGIEDRSAGLWFARETVPRLTLCFKTGDSCINQLISIIHEIYKSFHGGYDIQGVFLEAFDKVWHQGLHCKLRQNGISGELLNTLTDFLDNRTQRVILNGQYSSWAKVEAGVPQGSILGPLLFLIYINDLSDNLASNSKLFADDTLLFSVVKSVDASNIDLNSDLKKIGEWVFQWKMSFNPDRTKQTQDLILFLAKCKRQIIHLYFSMKMSFRRPPFKSI